MLGLSLLHVLQGPVAWGCGRHIRAKGPELQGMQTNGPSGGDVGAETAVIRDSCEAPSAGSIGEGGFAVGRPILSWEGEQHFGFFPPEAWEDSKELTGFFNFHHVFLLDKQYMFVLLRSQ